MQRPDKPDQPVYISAVKPRQLGSKSLCLLQGRSTGDAEFAKPFYNPQLGLLSETCSDRVTMFGKMGEPVSDNRFFGIPPSWYKKCPCLLLGNAFLFRSDRCVKTTSGGSVEVCIQEVTPPLQNSPRHQLVFVLWCKQNKYHVLISDFFPAKFIFGWSQASCSSCPQH